MPAGLTFGFAASDASFATSFVLATPTEQARPSRSRTSDRTWAAISPPEPSRRRAPVTSRKASSNAIGSTSGVTAWKIWCTSALVSE